MTCLQYGTKLAQSKKTTTSVYSPYQRVSLVATIFIAVVPILRASVIAFHNHCYSNIVTLFCDSAYVYIRNV